MWNTELNERWEELYSNGVLRGPGNCVMDPGQANAPNTPSRVPTLQPPALHFGTLVDEISTWYHEAHFLHLRSKTQSERGQTKALISGVFGIADAVLRFSADFFSGGKGWVPMARHRRGRCGARSTRPHLW